ncbi:hypothetical protein [Streptomyces sp. SYSU K217416]
MHCLSGPVAHVPMEEAERLGRELAELGGVQPTRTGLSQLSSCDAADGYADVLSPLTAPAP